MARRTYRRTNGFTALAGLFVFIMAAGIVITYWKVFVVIALVIAAIHILAWVEAGAQEDRRRQGRPVPQRTTQAHYSNRR